jgi:hypothetical protein
MDQRGSGKDEIENEVVEEKSSEEWENVSNTPLRCATAELCDISIVRIQSAREY